MKAYKSENRQLFNKMYFFGMTGKKTFSDKFLVIMTSGVSLHYYLLWCWDPYYIIEDN